tara:strand:+ start:599 stop:886 length:288 start_codon:yes stop_codon:yes gene_type:complete
MKTENTTVTLVDQLGTITKQMDELKKQADAIKNDLKNFCADTGIKKIAGQLYSVTYVEANRKSVDYKTLCADLKLDDDVLGKYTTQNAVFSIKVS